MFARLKLMAIQEKFLCLQTTHRSVDFHKSRAISHFIKFCSNWWCNNQR